MLTQASKSLYSPAFGYDDCNFFSYSSTEQHRVEKNVGDAWMRRCAAGDTDPTSSVFRINRAAHVDYLRKGLFHLPRGSQNLDASGPWLVYWITHSLELLHEPFTDEMIQRVTTYLSHCQSKTGGFGGGPSQLPHLATTYAAVMAACVLMNEDALKMVDRDATFAFIKSMKQQSGGFTMHEGGEVDIRAAYCAAAVASILALPLAELFEGTAEWVKLCQTYEGGFAAEPYAEAHGGYTFCGLATLMLIGRPGLLDLELLMRWLANKQMQFEGGFQGRTGKAVDTCYSFWQGACWPIICELISTRPEAAQRLAGAHSPTTLFDPSALMCYISICEAPSGGYIDKPDASRDYYHTCYGLSGLAIAQHQLGLEKAGALQNGHAKEAGETIVLKVNHPLLNITVAAEEYARRFFGDLVSN